MSPNLEFVPSITSVKTERADEQLFVAELLLSKEERVEFDSRSKRDVRRLDTEEKTSPRQYANELLPTPPFILEINIFTLHPPRHTFTREEISAHNAACDA